MLNVMKRLWTEEEGQGMAEYGLILALVAVAVIAALGTLKGGISEIFTKTGQKLNTEAGTVQ